MLEEDLKFNISKKNFVVKKTTPIEKEYTFGKVLGKGAYGTVYLGIQKSTKAKRTIKVIVKEGLKTEDILQKVEILASLSHPSILRIFEVFEDKQKLYIVGEYCQGGELFEMMKKKKTLTEKDVVIIMKQILSAIAYSHERGIIHMDLKPENILFISKNDRELNLKIIDWGCATPFVKGSRVHLKQGSLFYMSPEVIGKNADEKCDIWSCGVIMYIMLSGQNPFTGKNNEEILDSIRKAEPDFTKDAWKKISSQAKDLVKKMLTFHPFERPSALECLRHQFFVKNQDKNDLVPKCFSKLILESMRKFKSGCYIEKIAVSFIVNQILSQEENLETVKLFREMDKNKNGLLSKSEIIDGLTRAFGKMKENEINNIIKNIDLDGNKVIDFNEFLICTISREKVLTPDNLKTFFDNFDLEHKGKLTPEKFAAYFQKGVSPKFNAHLTREYFDKLFKYKDTKCGEVSFSQFKAQLKKFFE